MSPDPVFVDTWGWIVLGHRQDSKHKEVKKFYGELCNQRAAIYTSDYILDEVITLLFRREIFSEALRFVEGVFNSAIQGSLIIECITLNPFAVAWSLRKKFQDKPFISFTDITSIGIMQENVIKHILTDDEHFTHVGMGFKLVL